MVVIIFLVIIIICLPSQRLFTLTNFTWYIEHETWVICFEGLEGGIGTATFVFPHILAVLLVNLSLCMFLL